MDLPDKTRFDLAHQYLAFLLQLIVAIGIGLEMAKGVWGNAAIASGILLLTFLPAILARRLDVHIPPEFEVLTIAFVFAALFLGEIQDYYNRFWWWDIALHATSGLLLGVLGFLLVYVLNETPQVDLHMRPGFVAFFALCFAIAIGTLWEIYEFAMDQLFGLSMQTPMLGDPSGLTDTMFDLMVDTLGALIISLAGYFYMASGNESPIDRGIQRFIERNPRLFTRGKKR
jgi:uncharacterized membrane protein YjdF